jgi:hypothetical protein
VVHEVSESLAFVGRQGVRPQHLLPFPEGGKDDRAKIR